MWGGCQRTRLLCIVGIVLGHGKCPCAWCLDLGRLDPNIAQLTLMLVTAPKTLRSRLMPALALSRILPALDGCCCTAPALGARRLGAPLSPARTGTAFSSVTFDERVATRLGFAACLVVSDACVCVCVELRTLFMLTDARRCWVRGGGGRWYCPLLGRLGGWRRVGCRRRWASRRINPLFRCVGRGRRGLVGR